MSEKLDPNHKIEYLPFDHPGVAMPDRPEEVSREVYKYGRTDSDAGPQERGHGLQATDDRDENAGSRADRRGFKKAPKPGKPKCLTPK